jgi:hypothetical protein
MLRNKQVAELLKWRKLEYTSCRILLVNIAGHVHHKQQISKVARQPERHNRTSVSPSTSTVAQTVLLCFHLENLMKI